MEFGIKKSGILIMKRGKMTLTEGIELPSGDTMKDIEKKEFGIQVHTREEYD